MGGVCGLVNIWVYANPSVHMCKFISVNTLHTLVWQYLHRAVHIKLPPDNTITQTFAISLFAHDGSHGCDNLLCNWRRHGGCIDLRMTSDSQVIDQILRKEIQQRT